ARELGIPAVVGVEGALAAAAAARAADVDGGSGVVRLLAGAATAGRPAAARRRLAMHRSPLPLLANVGSARAAELAAARGAGGVGDPQVRAVSRVAAVHANIGVIMLMVATGNELSVARARFRSAARRRGAALPSIGMMVELPATAAALPAFAGLVDFVRLGTN